VAYADMLNNQTPERLSDDEMLTFLKGVSSGADRLRRLIENFILLVELETKDANDVYQMRKAAVNDLESLLNSIVERYQKTTECIYAFEVRVSGTLPAFTGDRDYLAKAVNQLLDNAAKFSEDGKPIIVGAHTGNGEVHIWVKDEGRGIPPEELKRIWESFYQINRALHEDQGAGAGLAIVRGIAEMHGGRVEANSQFGTGSTFTMILPANV
jgi:signal transduction histidine kinase